MKKPNLPLVCSLLVFIILTTSLPARGQENPHRILLLPFNIFAPNEYGYLQDGIAASLNSRLRRPGVEPLIPTDAILNATAKAHGPLTQEAIQTIAVSLGAELAIEGSVTIVGNAVSTTIQLWKVPEANSRVSFHASGDSPEAVLEHIDQFLLRLEDELSVPATASDQAVTAIQPPPPPAVGAPAVSWQSQRMPSACRGMAIADLSPKPGQEIAIINDQDLMIYKREDNGLSTIATIKGKAYLRLVAVDAGDIDGNGRTEIFVTAYHTRQGQPRSFVVEWLDSQERFGIKFEGLPTYFRITAVPSGGDRLIGQPKGLNDFFGKQPAFMAWNNGYVATTPIELPSSVQIYDFATGLFLSGENPDATITLTQRKKIRIYQAPDHAIWTSEDSYGGSSVYLDDGQTPQNQTKQIKQVGEETLKRVYLHPRMILKDLDKDGIQELLVVRNKDATGGLFRRARLLTSGRIACLNWQPLGPVAKWETPKVSGHITDMALDDTDGNGQYELVYLVVDREKKKIDSQQSYIVSHNLTAYK